MKLRKIILVLSLGMVVLFFSSCTSDSLLSEITPPSDLTAEAKIDTSKFDVPIENIDEIRKKLSSKPVIPETRESKDLKDPFIAKSLKGLLLLQKKDVKEEGKVNGQDTGDQQTTVESPKQKSSDNKQDSLPIDIAQESPMMFNFEGQSISGNERRAILRHMVNNRTYIVKKGDIVGGYTIVDITDDSLVLIKGSEKLVITKRKK